MTEMLIGAIAFAIWSVTLFWGKDIGLSMFLFVFPFTYFILDLLERNQKIKNKKIKMLVIPILLLASSYVIFDNEFFNCINIIVIPALVIIMIMGLVREKFQIKLDWIKEMIEIVMVPISFVSETFEKLRQTIENKLKINLDGRKDKKIKKVVKGILITIPIVFIIILLLSSADEVFGNLFIRNFI